MKISIITVCYNSEETIENCIKSVLSQTYPDIEYIVIDGASTDSTVDIIEKHRDDLAFFISEPDKGMYDAMNKAIKLATGDWLFFLNSDDKFMQQNSVDRAVKELIGFDGDILLSDIFLDHEINADIHNRVLSYKNFSIMTMYYIGLYQQAMFFKRELFEKFGGFDENYKIISDIDWIYKNHKKLKIKYVPQVYCNFLIGGRSSNESFEELNTREHKILEEKYLVKWQMNFYEWLKSKEKEFHWFAHKHFRSLARNEKISAFVRDSFWSTVNTIMGWKVKTIKG